MTFTLPTLLLAATLALSANAAIYQCEVNGQTVFADSPCGSDVKVLEHKPAARTGGVVGSSGSEDFLEHRAVKNRVQAIDRGIGRLEDRRNDLKATMDRQIRVWQRQQSRANDNLAGATWKQGQAEEAEVNRARHQAEIDEINQEIDRLHERRTVIIG